MPTYECSIEASLANEAIMDQLNAAGKAALDHITLLGDQFLIVLTTDEIKTLQVTGIKVKCGAKLIPRNQRSDIGVSGGLDLSTGFVSCAPVSGAT